MSEKISVDKICTKENPLKISSKKELKSLCPRTYIKFICQSCSREFMRRYRNDSVLLCKQCKTKKFCLEHYGVDWTAKIPEAIEKGRKTLESHGGYTLQRADSKEKVKNTMETKYGVSHPMQSKEIKDKLKKTNNKKYGGNSPMSSPEVRKKVKESTIAHFGNLNHSLELAKKSNLEKFGVENPFYCEEVRRQKYYKYDNQKFDSRWELVYYIYNKDIGKNIIRNKTEFFIYMKNGKEKKYFPDFKIDNKFIEIKGDHFFKNGEPIDIYGNSWIEKYNCIIENRVNLLKYSDIKECENYVISHYGKDFILNLQVLK